jgi:hypothetical protein
MAKRKGGGLKLKQQGMKRPAAKKTAHKKGHGKGPGRATWDDPLKDIARGGSRH